MSTAVNTLNAAGLLPPVGHRLLVLGGCGGMGRALVSSAVAAGLRVAVMAAGGGGVVPVFAGRGPGGRGFAGGVQVLRRTDHGGDYGQAATPGSSIAGQSAR